MAKEIIYCPLKFTSRTLTDDGFVRKTTCECEESRCAWWQSEKNRCSVMTLAESFDTAQKLDKVKLRLMLAGGQDREIIESVSKAFPFLEAQKDITEALK